MSTYSNLLRTPGVGRIIAAQLTARFPFGMLSLAFLLHIEHIHRSYGAAGLVLGAMSVGQAIAGPMTSRLMGVLGMRAVLWTTLLLCAAAVAGIGLLRMPIPLTMAVAFFAGLSMPPIQPAVRTIYPKMVNSRQLTPLFSLDASAQEIIWIAGPVAITFVSTQIGTVEGILMSVAIMLLGGFWFISSPEVGRVRIPRSKRRFGVVLARPPVLLATVVGFLLIGSCAAVEAGVVATFGEGSPFAGIVLAIWSLGSLVGGLAFGHVPIGPWATARRMLIVFVGVLLSTFMLWSWWGLSLTLIIAGLGIAPALAVLFAIVSASVKFSDTAEAYGWVGTGQLIGAALGSALAGFLIDSSGPVGAFWIAGAFAFAGFVVPALAHRVHPDLRGRDASPLPDTEPVPVQPS
ncbi:MFS transporter [Leifsonia xyli subsp. xyli]|uniref:ABC transporter, permease protein n=2 Tax=Leifsonia xyli subsp. xyli TaxID=59736 RepID=Q6ADM2_LEIXX|nr:MFS transporter [Leifsonia xyli]AAT89524.1 ABC transporter, permease protein [Leifsonia xyli subsp. xyli str. CTCB07]ODA91361.1 MFS transporter [Leifsonia xyli subsp. xyli]